MKEKPWISVIFNCSLIAATKNMTTLTNILLKLELKSINSLDCNPSAELFVPFKHGSTISVLFQDTRLSANLNRALVIRQVKQSEPFFKLLSY